MRVGWDLLPATGSPDGAISGGKTTRRLVKGPVSAFQLVTESYQAGEQLDLRPEARRKMRLLPSKAHETGPTAKQQSIRRRFHPFRGGGEKPMARSAENKGPPRC